MASILNEIEGQMDLFSELYGVALKHLAKGVSPHAIWRVFDSLANTMEQVKKAEEQRHLDKSK